MKAQTKHESKTIQRNCGKSRGSKDRADKHPFVDISTERSTLEDNQDEFKEISDNAADGKFIKKNSNDCDKVEEWAEEEESSSDAQEQLEKMTPMKKIEAEEDEIKFENAERVGTKKDEVSESVNDSFELLKEIAIPVFT